MSRKSYHEQTKNNPPRPLLTDLLDLQDRMGCPGAKRAIDLGCGSGQDAIHLLKRGWTVLAIDNSVEAMHILTTAAEPWKESLHTRLENFEELTPLPKVDLIYASLSLPSCSAAQFPRLWERMLGAMEDDAWIAVDFFGPEDDWVKSNRVNGHSQAEIRKLLENYQIEKLSERKQLGKTRDGEVKFFHVISAIARARPKV